jgi:hypothetical protein
MTNNGKNAKLIIARYPIGRLIAPKRFVNILCTPLHFEKNKRKSESKYVL